MSFGFDYASVDSNKPPNWPDLIKAGFSFVWLRASFAYWDASHGAWACVGDPTFHRDWANIPASIPRGAYMFPVLNSSFTAEQQVATFVRSVKDAGGLRPGIDFSPCLDVEFPGKGIAGTGMDRVGVLAWVRAAVVALEAAFGVKPIIYTSGRVWNDSDADCLGNPSASDLIDCPLWLARYPYKTRVPAVLPPPADLPQMPVPTPWAVESGYVAWQYQGDALGIPGLTATADVDKFHVLSPGNQNPLVRWYKRKLGLPFGSMEYDSEMCSTVRALQVKNGLVPDAVLGPKSFAAVAWLSSLHAE